MFGQQSYNGVAILSRTACDTSQRGYPDSEELSQARLLAVNLVGINIVNVYIPNGQALVRKSIFSNWIG